VEVTVRRIIVIALCVLSFLVSLPAPAHAWWDWLDEFSGPGPFTGVDLQWRLHCIQDPDAFERAKQALNISAPASSLTPEQRQQIDEKLKSADPGDYVLRSLDSFKHKGWAGLLGAGCVTGRTKNPVGSLNLRTAFLWSVQNHLDYGADAPPGIFIFQPELSYSVFVDARRSVEIGSAVGVSNVFVHKEGVPAIGLFYWRPIVLTIAPVSLLRVSTNSVLRAIIFSASIAITPQGLKDTDFGARAGTFRTDRDMQGSFAVAIDLSRLGAAMGR
jgi:hypothetical protein